ncbi:MAG: hypothetical protein EON48_10860, partial [Acetobacteraceae bacterium]
MRPSSAASPSRSMAASSPAACCPAARIEEITMRLARTLALLLCLATPAAAQAPRPLVWGDNFTSGMDPHAIFDVPSQFVLLNVYDGLYRYQGNDLVPWLAEGHTVSADGLTWDFRLREGIR